jgi:ionotropic glutamate receptor
MKGGFNQLLTVTRDPKYNTTKFSGNLPYALPYEYIPFANPNA